MEIILYIEKLRFPPDSVVLEQIHSEMGENYRESAPYNVFFRISKVLVVFLTPMNAIIFTGIARKPTNLIVNNPMTLLTTQQP